MIILFGSYARGQGVEHIYQDKGITYEYKSDYDLLIICSKNSQANADSFVQSVTGKLDELNLQTPINSIFHGIEFVSHELREGNYFFDDIKNEGKLLFNTSRYTLDERRILSAKEMQTFNGLVSPYFQPNTTQFNTAFLMFSNRNDRFWATYMGAPLLTMAGCKGLGYNVVNNNLFFGGAASNNVTNYPFRNFTNPQAYWQNVNTGGTSGSIDAFAGRFNLTGVIGINEYQKAAVLNNLIVYPNPSSNFVNFVMDANVTKPYAIKVFDALGKLVYNEMIFDTYTTTHTLNFENLSRGMYFIQAVSNEVNKSAKLIKQ